MNFGMFGVAAVSDQTPNHACGPEAMDLTSFPSHSLSRLPPQMDNQTSNSMHFQEFSFLASAIPQPARIQSLHMAGKKGSTIFL